MSWHSASSKVWSSLHPIIIRHNTKRALQMTRNSHKRISERCTYRSVCSKGSLALGCRHGRAS